jgi:hypothetical protein
LIRINSCDWMEELPDFGWWIGQDHRAGHVDVVLAGPGGHDESSAKLSTAMGQKRPAAEPLVVTAADAGAAGESEKDPGRRAGIIIHRLLGEVEWVTGEATEKHQSVFQRDVRHV